ncbi:MAG: hypothetical protein AAFX05_07520 [Planctomycetota bacterium]
MLIALLGTLAACSAPSLRPSTLYSAADMQIIASDVVQSLAVSDFLVGRNERSDPIVLQPDRMWNLSNERLSQADKLAAVTRVLYDRGMQELLAAKNVAILYPLKDRWRVEHLTPEIDVDPFRDAGLDRPSSGLRPTHLLQAQFNSVTRTAASREGQASDTRTDLFSVDYTIVEVDSRRIVWAATSQVKRFAHGSLID